MILAQILGLSLFGAVNAATLGKRFSSADFATGETDPNVNSGCTYWANSIQPTDTCAALESYYGITHAQLVSWNPSLKATDCTLNEKWSYCVEAPTVPTTTEKTTTTTEAPATTTSTSTGASATKTTAAGPSPTQPGLISSCNAFHYVQKDDSCWGIANSYGNFTVEQFYSWNPAVKTDCSGLQPSYYVCVGVAGSTASTTTSKATTASPTTTSAPHSPQQSGIISICNNYYFVEAGDECALIAAKNGITLSDFYSWNPAVGSTCSSLQAGYWVCIGVSGGTATTHATTTKTTTSTTTTAGTGPTPTQSGIIADCSAYYQAQEGDDCWSIINKKYSYLTAAKFYEWNPAIGPSCSNLQQGYYYCVATKREGPMPDTISSCAKWHLVASGDSCWSIEQEYSITSTQFASWNPYVGSSCTTLWLGYYVCVGV